MTDKQLAQENRQLRRRLIIAALGMFAFGFALVPFYKTICEVTGINKLFSPDDAVANTQIDTSRTVLIELDSNTHNMPWKFTPLQNSVRVHPGELIRVDYEVINTQDHPVTGQAIPSYGPMVAANYFRKLECFCFRQQTLAAGEKRVMPVLFTVDNQLPEQINTITLSYTFFEVEGASTRQDIQSSGAG